VLVTAAVVPGPPAFVVELMGAAAHELDELRQAADQVISQTLSDLLATSAESRESASPSGPGLAQLVVVGPGEPGEYEAAGPVSFAGFGCDIVLPALAEGLGVGGKLPTPIMVARYLARRDLQAHPEHAGLWASARWVTTRGADAKALGQRLGGGDNPVGLILVADGAACHGPKAPRAEDARAPAYDAQVCEALASGRPARLSRTDAQLGEELGATGYQVWPVLEAAAGGVMTGEVRWAGAPYGVGWAVASWRRSVTSAT
jgi:hypothetical protein